MIHHRGVALLTVLMITALVSVIAIGVFARHHVNVLRTQASTQGAQALSYALGAEDYARELLYQDFVEDNNTIKTDTLADVWARPEAPFEIENGLLQLQVVDAQGKLNVNVVGAGAGGGTNAGTAEQVRATPGIQRLQNLLIGLGGDPATADKIKDWIDSDQDITGFGAEDGNYLLRDPPYRAANQPMVDPSELQLIEDIDPVVMTMLQHGVSALPDTIRQVNVNTAQPAGLLAMTRDISLDEAQSIVDGERDYKQVAQFVNDHRGFGAALDGLSVSSEVFEAHIRVDFADSTVHLTSVIHRDPTSGKTEVWSRNFGHRWFPGPAAPDAADTPNTR